MSLFLNLNRGSHIQSLWISGMSLTCNSFSGAERTIALADQFQRHTVLFAGTVGNRQNTPPTALLCNWTDLILSS